MADDRAVILIFPDDVAYPSGGESDMV